MTVLLYNGTHRAVSEEITVDVAQFMTVNLTYDGTMPEDVTLAWIERKNSENEFRRFSLSDGIDCVFNHESLSITIPIPGVYRFVRPTVDARYGISIGAEYDIGASAADPDQTISTTRSGKDGNGVYTTITFTRSDATVFKTSVLSGGTSPEYTTRTETFYAADGTTETNVIVYALTYDAGDLVSEIVV